MEYVHKGNGHSMDNMLAMEENRARFLGKLTKLQMGMTMKFAPLVFFLLLACSQSNPNRTGNDYLLFEATPIWKLASAIRDHELCEVRRLAADEKYDINFQEPKFGLTVLMLTIVNKDFDAFQTLLDLGADVNIHDHYDGSSAIIDAADLENVKDEYKFLELLIKKGANPNDEEVGPRLEGNTTRQFPLLVACGDVIINSSPVKKVEMLISAGALVNHTNEFNESPLKNASTFDHYDVVLYLLENGADVHTVFDEYDGRKLYLVDQMRISLFPLGSVEHREKMRVVDFLASHGVDYRESKIPEYALKEAKKLYPADWKDYLQQY